MKISNSSIITVGLGLVVPTLAYHPPSNCGSISGILPYHGQTITSGGVSFTIGPGGTYSSGGISFGTFAPQNDNHFHYYSGELCDGTPRQGHVDVAYRTDVTEAVLEGTDNPGCNKISFITLPCFPAFAPPPGGNGDPHFRTFTNEHFEFHGQCDLVMTRVKNFIKEAGIDLDIHIRTKMVRHWSYIKAAAIRIGDDILEVEGSAPGEDGFAKRHYRSNFEYRGELDTLGGFPVTISPRNNVYTVDLDSAYAGLKIEIKTFKEFVSVKMIGATEESFGNAVGILGEFKTGKTLARDGSTVLNDFNDLGLEWQVLPSDGKLFYAMAKPQFPELCYLPEDPRGERTRRLAESGITEEAAEKACAGLNDEIDRKDCVYDILATQDMDMVGAY